MPSSKFMTGSNMSLTHFMQFLIFPVLNAKLSNFLWTLSCTISMASWTAGACLLKLAGFNMFNLSTQLKAVQAPSKLSLKLTIKPVIINTQYRCGLFPSFDRTVTWLKPIALKTRLLSWWNWGSSAGPRTTRERFRNTSSLSEANKGLVLIAHTIWPEWRGTG